MKNLPKKIYHKGEQIFANSLKARGLEFIYQPAVFHVGRHQYRPDFYIPSEGVFYEVVGTRSAFYRNRKKMIMVQKVYPFIQLRAVKPDGLPYCRNQLATGMLKEPIRLKLRPWRGLVDISEFDSDVQVVRNFFIDGHTTREILRSDLHLSQGTLDRILNPLYQGTPHPRTRAMVCNYAKHLKARFPNLVGRGTSEKVAQK